MWLLFFERIQIQGHLHFTCVWFCFDVHCIRALLFCFCGMCSLSSDFFISRKHHSLRWIVKEVMKKAFSLASLSVYFGSSFIVYGWFPFLWASQNRENEIALVSENVWRSWSRWNRVFLSVLIMRLAVLYRAFDVVFVVLHNWSRQIRFYFSFWMICAKLKQANEIEHERN